MKIYNPKGRCPKCGGNDFKVTYTPGSSDVLREADALGPLGIGFRLFLTQLFIKWEVPIPVESPEKIKKTCNICGFYEEVLPVDHELTEERKKVGNRNLPIINHDLKSGDMFVSGTGDVFYAESLPKEFREK